MANRLVYKTNIIDTSITYTCNIPLNKSIEARRMVMLAYNDVIYHLPKNDSVCEDLLSLNKSITDFFQGKSIINVGESGTAMRLLTSFIALKTRQRIRLEGTARQHKRPIKPLVLALRKIGAVIDYVEDEGFPPLNIYPIRKTKATETISTTVECNQSSQYLSSLLIALSNLSIGSNISILGNIVSSDYINMTLMCLDKMGIHYSFDDNTYTLIHKYNNHHDIDKEYDFSAISFIFEIVSLMPLEYSVLLKDIKYSSMQGDCKATIDAYKCIGVQAYFDENGLTIVNKGCNTDSITIDMVNSPDLVPAFVCSLLGKNIAFKIKGISHLEVKESNRIEAIISESTKIGYILNYIDGELCYNGEKIQYINETNTVLVSHHDHRIAMSLAPLVSIKHNGAIIKDSGAVEKSFPSYWDEINKLGIKNKEI